jgi:hypoxanthine phosphoribosyltransferase
MKMQKDLKLPENYQLEYSSEVIAASVATMASEITAWASEVYDKNRSDLVVVPVMRGGMFFCADLVRQIPVSVEITPVTTSSYSSTKNSTPFLEVRVDFKGADFFDRSVLVVDDICDSGRTLVVLGEKLKLAGAKEVHSAVLINRIVPSPLHQPRWSGFKYNGDEWFVGYGLEDANRWRNLSSIYKIKN